MDDQLRDARKEIDAVIEDLKTKAAALSEQAAVRLKSGERLRAAGLSTGDMGPLKADARAALDQIAHRVKGTEPAAAPATPAPVAPGEIEVGSRVAVGALGLEGVVARAARQARRSRRARKTAARRLARPSYD